MKYPSRTQNANAGKRARYRKRDLSSMAISKKEFLDIITPDANIERISTISSDGRNLLSMVPKEIVDFLGLKKGHKLRWYVDVEKRSIQLEIVKK